MYGCGPLGLLLVQLSRLVGADVAVATDPLAHRADAAHALGATKVLQTRRAGSELLPARLRNGLDVVFEVAGDDDAVATALDTLRPGGLLVLVGIPSRRPHLVHGLGRAAQGSDDRALPADAARATSSGRSRSRERRDVELASLVTDRFPLTRGAEAFAALGERRGLKVVVEPQREAA